MFVTHESFQALMGLYCFVAVLILAHPLPSVLIFLFFRSHFQIAAYKGFQSFLGLPYFLPPIVLLAIATAFALSRRRYIKIPLVAATYVAFSCFVAIFALTSKFNPTDYIDLIVKSFCPLFIYILTLKGIKSEFDVFWLLQKFEYLTFVPLGTGLVQAALGVGYDYRSDSLVQGLRITGTIIDPNLYGIYIALSMAIVLPLVLARGAKIDYFTFGLLLFTALVAKNRGTWIALLISFGIAVISFRSHLRLGYWFSGAAVIILLASPVLVSRFSDLERYDEYGQSLDTFSERVNHHTFLLKKSLEKPLFGSGVHSAEMPVSVDSNLNILPHNDYIRIAVESGYLCVIVYLAFLLMQLWGVWKVRGNRLWEIQFGAFLSQVYLIIISLAQNVYADIMSYSLIMFLMAISHRSATLAWEATCYAERNSREKLPVRVTEK